MRDPTVAGRYARALFIVTEKRGETSQALLDLKSLVEVLEPHSRISRLLAAPLTRLQERRDVMRKGLEGRVLNTVLVFLDLLLRKKRLGEFASIVDEFEELVDQALGIQQAHVVSAVPLEPDETKRLQEALERHTRTHIRLSAETDPALLGGVMVRIRDHVVDRSVRGMLETIEKQLHEVSV
jgi:F-type H+-transporting ATPase subunit delta